MSFVIFFKSILVTIREILIVMCDRSGKWSKIIRRSDISYKTYVKVSTQTNLKVFFSVLTTIYINLFILISMLRQKSKNLLSLKYYCENPIYSYGNTEETFICYFSQSSVRTRSLNYLKSHVLYGTIWPVWITWI